MDKDSIYELQKIDCNCNDCIFMQRDFDTYKKWEAFHKDLQHKDFDRDKNKALKIAEECKDEKGKKTLMSAANKMRFVFNKNGLIQYGNCSMLNKPVSFQPNVCQIDTQRCFLHRKDAT